MGRRRSGGVRLGRGDLTGEQATGVAPVPTGNERADNLWPTRFLTVEEAFLSGRYERLEDVVRYPRDDNEEDRKEL